MRKLFFALSILLLSCSSDGLSKDGLPVINGHELAGFTTPLGPVYFGGSEDDPLVVAHEECHLVRMKKMGSSEYLSRYFSDPEWACSEERICGWTGTHPMCDKE